MIPTVKMMDTITMADTIIKFFFETPICSSSSTVALMLVSISPNRARVSLMFPPCARSRSHMVKFLMGGISTSW